MPRKVPDKVAKDGARTLFERRRGGLDTKARTLILMLSKVKVDLRVTIIYDYQGEISCFDSGGSGPWFSTMDELVSRSLNL
jgi:hypothetical protein